MIFHLKTDACNALSVSFRVFRGLNQRFLCINHDTVILWCAARAVLSFEA